MAIIDISAILLAMLKITTKKIKAARYQVDGVGNYPLSAAVLWQRAGSPNFLAPDCLNLKSFATAPEMAVGNEVTETHVFGGIPQKYQGQICQYDEGKSWAMGTHPTTLRWLFGLPHFVEYSFADNMMKIKVLYDMEGVLRLPGVSWLTRRRMEKAVAKLLMVAA